MTGSAVKKMSSKSHQTSSTDDSPSNARSEYSEARLITLYGQPELSRSTKGLANLMQLEVVDIISQELWEDAGTPNIAIEIP